MNYEEFFNKVAELVKQADTTHTNGNTGSGSKCNVHSWNEQPVELKAYAKKDGGTYYAHKRNFGSAEEPDWKTCFGKGWVERKS